jgi:tripartite-type tricarboxylate transporter receptor subunit TctC
MNADKAEALLLSLLLAASGAAHCDDFPAKPARIVVPIGPGSSMDIVARVLAQKLNASWGQPVIVDNRAGAGGNIGADTFAKALPDGYTLLFASSSFAISRSVYRKLPYDALRDFEPVTQISSRSNVLVVNPTLPVNSVKELVALARAKPWQLSFGSGGGNGSSDQMGGSFSNCWRAWTSCMSPIKAGPRRRTTSSAARLRFTLAGYPYSCR